MDNLTTEFLFSLLIVLVGFVICTFISIISAYAAVIGLFLVSGIAFLFSSDFAKGIPILVLGVLGYLLSFPIGAWFLQIYLRQIEPNWLYHNTFTFLFGSSGIFLYVVWRNYIRFSEYRRNWHPQNGEQKIYQKTGELLSVRNWKDGKLHGEVIRYCYDGRVSFKSHYENGKKIGAVFETNCSDYMLNRTESFYKPAGVLISEKQFIEGVLSHQRLKDENTEVIKWYNKNEELISEQISELKIDSLGREVSTISNNRHYDIETGNVLTQEIHEYLKGKTKLTRIIYDSKTGEKLSENTREF